MKTTRLLLAATMTLIAMSGALHAQPPMRGPGGFGGPPRGTEGRMRRNDSKRQLDQLMRGLGQVERSAAPLNRAQAQRIVTLLRPWQSRPTMTQAQAKSLAANLNNVLTAQQKNLLNARREERRGARPDGMRGEGRGGMRRPRGEGGPPPRDGFGAPPRRGGFNEPRSGEGAFDPQAMRAQRQKMRGLRETINPLYPPSRYSQVKSLPARVQQGMMRRYQQTQATMSALTRRASGQ